MLAQESSGLNSSFQGFKVCVVVWYGPSEGDGEERDMFWNHTDKILDSIRNGYRFCIPDLNGWIGDRTRASITGAFRAP